jgi:hypothetical protein
MSDKIELSGGPYIVKRNACGGVEISYGWSELIIEGNIIKVSCTDDDNYSRIILKFGINNIIPRDYKILEKIQIYLKIGYNSIYAYSYASIEKFIAGCKDYFHCLDKELTEKKECEICDKCNGTGKYTSDSSYLVRK